MFMTTNISPLELHLDESNPRFRVNIHPSQDDIRKYMIKHEKLLVLANSMTNMNTLLPGERVIIFNDGEKNIVLEGNRRTSVYQMLLDRSLVPADILSSFPVAKDEFLSEISNIPVDVVKSRHEAMAFLAARHIVGVEKWSSVSKWKISYEYFKDGNSINEIANRLVMSANKVRTSIRNYKVLLRGINSPNWTKEEKIRLSPLDIKPDKLIRILGLKDTSERLGFSYSESYDLLSNKFDEATITKFIVLLTKMAFITGEVDTRTSIDDIWTKVISLIPELNIVPHETDDPPANPSYGNHGASGGNQPPSSGTPPKTDNGDKGGTPPPPTSGGSTSRTGIAGTGGKKNVPYFFDGLQYGHLDRNLAVTHGVARVCDEVRKFSSKKLVNEFPIAAAFLTRSLIEQSLIYYSKTHNVQAQDKLIWSRIHKGSREPQLSEIVDCYKKCLPDYIIDQKIRDYFVALFQNYNTTANPLNWVVHRPDEFVVNPQLLMGLPGNGLLSVINYLLL